FGHACDYLRKHNREDDFIKVAERLLWHKPDNIDLNRELATLYLRRRDARRALQKLQTCFKANPRDVETLSLLAQAFQALDQKGKTGSVLTEMARVLVEAGKRREAEEVHRKILTFAPNDPDSKAFLQDARPARETGPAAPVAEEVLEPAPRRTAQRGVYNPTGSVPIVNPEEQEPDSAAYPELGESSGSGPAYRLASEGYEVEPGSHSDLVAELSLDDDSFDGGDSSVRGEVHADEIAKVLTETDVYVKYGLHQKAIDHLRKVFALDPHNIEARQRLKDVLLAQGRMAEAATELVRMAEQMAPLYPERAEVYLRELMRLSPDDPRGVELAGRFRLDLTGAEEVEILDDDDPAVIGQGSGLLGGDPSGTVRAAGSGAEPVVEQELDFDALDLDSGDDLGEAAVTVEQHEEIRGGPRAARPPSSRYEADGFEFELADDDDEIGRASCRG